MMLQITIQLRILLACESLARWGSFSIDEGDGSENDTIEKT